MRPAGHTTLVIPALVLALTATSALADVQVDLTAIGGRTEADARIAPGKAPVQLRYPGETPPTRILLTPPASVRQSQESPRILGPTDATAVEVQPAQVTPSRSGPAPTPAPIPAPATRTAAPTPQSIAPRPPAAAAQAPADKPTALTPLVPPIAAAPNAAPVDPISAPTPAAALAETEQEQPVQVASLPAPQSANHRLRFEGNTADILGGARDELELVAMELMRHDDRIEIQAFAGAAGDVSSDARRLSLKRALNVRKFLVERGVLQSRIDVRALGGTRDSGPANRVDILLSSR
ncbi:MAG: OmpA family protein [Rhodobiaceae bacterium]|nr:OmpA family protein [Rhodobiaceae bacterium]